MTTPTPSQPVPLHEAGAARIPAAEVPVPALAVVDRLRDLHAGPAAFPDVVALGDAAVPGLEALLRGPPESIHHARRLAADALAAIGSAAATAALIRALHDCVAREPDAVSLEAEGVIVNRIAEHLGTVHTAAATQALLDALARRPYPYCAAALGLQGEPRAIPLLLSCLHDDTARAAALTALRRFGGSALQPLLYTLRHRSTTGSLEPPRSADARAAAATALGDIPDPAARRALVRALCDRAPRVRLAAALALAGHGGNTAAQQAAAVLVTQLGEADWMGAERIARALVRMRTTAERAVLAAIAAEPRDPAGRARRLRAIGVAARLGTDGATALLASLHQCGDASLRLAAVAVLTHDPAITFDHLRGYLADSVAAIRQRALNALSHRGLLRAEQAAQLLGDKDHRVRQLAGQHLKACPGAARPALRHAIRHLGAPLHGLAPRWHLWSQACLLLATLPTPTARPRQGVQWRK